MTDTESLIPPHGGFRNLKSFRVAQLVYDVTVAFCDRHIARRSRTHDQMVQAARSGVQNVAEGSEAGGTSKKLEMKLTGVARASLEELRLDYEDYLRQRGLAAWPPDHPALMRFKARRCASPAEVQDWLEDEMALQSTQPRVRSDPDRETHGAPATDTGWSARQPPGPVRVRRCRSVSVRASPCDAAPCEQLEANAALSLLNVCCHLLSRQLEAQAAAFERDGGFTERLYDRRRAAKGR